VYPGDIKNREAQGNMANQAGKRYVCKKCGAELIVTRAGDGTISHCGEAMELKK
jgi:ribosomal protein L37AE/L43A